MANAVPDNLAEGLKKALQGKRKIGIRSLVKVEKDKGKLEDKVIALSSYRLYLLSTKDPNSIKIDESIHYLEIAAIESKKPNQLTIKTSHGSATKVYNMHSHEVSSNDVDQFISYIIGALKTVFPSVPTEKLILTMDIQPAERLKLLQSNLREIEKKSLGPCGGYSHMYSCMCSYHETPFREEVTWDVDMIYFSQQTKELRLKDFDHMYPRDLVPILSALEYNLWFTKLNANKTKDKLTPDALSRVLKICKKNTTLQELCLSETGIKVEFMRHLSLALTSNTATALTSLDLSHNNLEDKGVTYMSGPLGKLPKGLHSLNLASVGMTGKGLIKLIDGLWSNRDERPTLRHLDLSGNSLSKNMDDSSWLVFLKFLSELTALEELKLANAELTFESMADPLLRGCSQNLQVLDISHNSFHKGKSREIPLAWKNFFATAMSLRKVNVSLCQLPADALREMLLGIGSNRHIKDYDLNISSNELRSDGSNIIAGCIANLPITRLDISDNGFDKDMIQLLAWIQHNKHIKHLAIGRNFSGILLKSGWLSSTDKDSPIKQVLDKILDLIVDESSNLESLSLADSKLRAETSTILNGLGSNHKLVYLDISGNLMEDFGARMLAKALQLNTKLQTILWDRNNISATGLEDMAFALESNYTVLDMPTPIHDASTALRSQPQRTEAALQKMEAYLQRNHRPNKTTADVEYRIESHRLQQDVERSLIGGADVLKHKLATLKDKGIEYNDSDSAAKLISDAENWRNLLPKCHEIVNQSETQMQSHVREVVNEMVSTFKESLQKTSEEIVQYAASECAATLENEGLSKRLKEFCSSECDASKSFPHDIIEDQVMGKFREVSLSISLEVSRQIVDQILQQISSRNETLKEKLSQKKKDEVDKADKKDEKEFVIHVAPAPDSKNASSSESVEASPAVIRKKRDKTKSIRPPSAAIHLTMDIRDIDIDEAMEQKPSNKITAPASISKPRLEVHEEDQLDGISELPPRTSTAKGQLAHLTKARPKRTKTRPATTARIGGHNPMDDIDDNEPPARPANTPSPRHNPHNNKTPPRPESPSVTKDPNVANSSTQRKNSATNKPGISGLKSGISNFFKKKDKPPSKKEAKDAPDSKPAEKSPSQKKRDPPQRPQVTPDKPKGQAGSEKKTEEKKEKPGVPPARPTVSSQKKAEAPSAPKPEVKESITESSKEDIKEEPAEAKAEEPVAPKRPMLPKPGMGGKMPSSLMQEMKAKRESKKPPVAGTADTPVAPSRPNRTPSKNGQDKTVTATSDRKERTAPSGDDAKGKTATTGDDAKQKTAPSSAERKVSRTKEKPKVEEIVDREPEKETMEKQTSVTRSSLSAQKSAKLTPTSMEPDKALLKSDDVTVGEKQEESTKPSIEDESGKKEQNESQKKEELTSLKSIITQLSTDKASEAKEVKAGSKPERPNSISKPKPAIKPRPKPPNKPPRPGRPASTVTARESAARKSDPSPAIAEDDESIPRSLKSKSLDLDKELDMKSPMDEAGDKVEEKRRSVDEVKVIDKVEVTNDVKVTTSVEDKIEVDQTEDSKVVNIDAKFDKALKSNDVSKIEASIEQNDKEKVSTDKCSSVNEDKEDEQSVPKDLSTVSAEDSGDGSRTPDSADTDDFELVDALENEVAV